MNVFVLEPGTLKLGGGVSDSSGGMISGVTVEVLSGTGKGLKATTGGMKDSTHPVWSGWAAATAATTCKKRLQAQVRDVVVTESAREPNRLLSSPVETPADVSGTWTMTVRSSHRCRAGLPDTAQGRTYEVRLIQQGTTLQWRMGETPTLEHGDAGWNSAVPSWAPAYGSYFPGTLTKASIRLLVLYDRLSPTEWFGFTGSAEGTITGQGFVWLSTDP